MLCFASETQVMIFTKNLLKPLAIGEKTGWVENTGITLQIGYRAQQANLPKNGRSA